MSSTKPSILDADVQSSIRRTNVRNDKTVFAYDRRVHAESLVEFVLDVAACVHVVHRCVWIFTVPPVHVSIQRTMTGKFYQLSNANRQLAIFSRQICTPEQTNVTVVFKKCVSLYLTVNMSNLVRFIARQARDVSPWPRPWS